MQKAKGESLLIPTVNICLESKGEKKKKGHGKGQKGKHEKENAHTHEQRKSILEVKHARNQEKDNDRLILPTIENKRINYRR